MAAEVSSLVRIMSEYKKDTGDDKSKRDLVTRDFLGCAVIGSKELDLDLEVPSGCERRLDLLSGETYLEKRGSRSNPVHRELHDLNLPPPPPVSDSSALDLRLLLPSAAPRSDYKSVCTLDKVRSALEREGRESQSKFGQQRSDGGGSPSPSSSATSSSMKRRAVAVAGDQEVEKGIDGSDSSSSAGLIAAGCPSCLMYVLISKGNPRCPRCNTHVPAPAPAPAPAVLKKPRIDLNFL